MEIIIRLSDKGNVEVKWHDDLNPIVILGLLEVVKEMIHAKVRPGAASQPSGPRLVLPNGPLQHPRGPA